MVNRNINNLKQIQSLVRGHYGKLSAAILLAVFSAGVSLIPYLIVYLMVERIYSGTFNSDESLHLALFVLGALVVRYLLYFFSTMLAHATAFKINYELKSAVIDHIGRLPLGYFSKQTSGIVKKTVGEDIDDLEIFIAHHVPDTTTAFAVSIIVFISLFVVDYRLALAAFIPLPFSLYLQSRSQKEYVENAVSYHDNQEKMNSIIVEYIKGMSVIKTFNLTVTTFHRFLEAVKTHISLAATIVKKTIPFYSLFRVGIDSGIFFICLVGTGLYMADEITLPVFILFLLIGNSFAGPFHEITTTTAMLENLFEGANRISDLLKTPPLAESRQPKLPANTRIEFKNVYFSFGDNEVLKGVSFSVAAGSLCAFVGPSGAGKTTTALLASRFWDPDKGEILIGGVPIREIPQQKLMEMVSFVFQDVVLLNGSVMENICMGNPSITTDDVISAAEGARAHEFISKLEQGYDTEIGEGGAYLSGGEKQRIAIARAIAKNSPIVVLDEATAFSDPENEAGIQEALNILLQEKTVIVIAHKLSTIVNADQILVFENGVVSGRGSHEEILKTNDMYRNMWQEHTKANSWLLTDKEDEDV